MVPTTRCDDGTGGKAEDMGDGWLVSSNMRELFTAVVGALGVGGVPTVVVGLTFPMNHDYKDKRSACNLPRRHKID